MNYDFLIFNPFGKGEFLSKTYRHLALSELKQLENLNLASNLVVSQLIHDHLGFSQKKHHLNYMQFTNSDRIIKVENNLKNQSLHVLKKAELYPIVDLYSLGEDYVNFYFANEDTFHYSRNLLNI